MEALLVAVAGAVHHRCSHLQQPPLVVTLGVVDVEIVAIETVATVIVGVVG